MKLIDIDRDWIPALKGFSLYIRPILYSTTPKLSLTIPTQAKLLICCSPVGPYFPTGFNAVNIYAHEKHVRCSPGGTGQYKLGGNYPLTIVPEKSLLKQGYVGILWLWKGIVTEIGAMNIFVYWKNKVTGDPEVVTCPLNGLVLPGITRKSVL